MVTGWMLLAARPAGARNGHHKGTLVIGRHDGACVPGG
jgi:hypothetical protein